MPNAPDQLLTLLTLAIETSNPSAAAEGSSGAGVALGYVRGGAVERMLGVEMLAMRTGGRGGHDDDLMPAIDRLCTRHAIKPCDLCRVAVSIGPGGYTGLRVACATGKMIAEGASAACVGIPSVLVVARGITGHAPRLAVVVASKNDSAWVWVEGDDPRAGRLMTAADLPPLHDRGVHTLAADRFLPAPMRERAVSLRIAIVEPVFDPAACLAVSATLPDIDPVELNPIYPREPDAVTLWRARKAAP